MADNVWQDTAGNVWVDLTGNVWADDFEPVDNDWLGELEDLMAAHIESTIDETVTVLIESEIDRPLTTPIITIMQVTGEREPTGGMNHVGDAEQGYWEIPSFFLTINTDRSSGGKAMRNLLASNFLRLCFGQSLHILKAATGATMIDVTPMAVTPSGPLSDDTIFQKQFMVDVRLIVSWSSLVL